MDARQYALAIDFLLPSLDIYAHMIRNGRDIPTGTVVPTQVCVIGSGPAGITVAWELQKAGVQVVLVEGSREWSTYEESWPDKYQLYKGETAGLFKSNEPEFLVLPYQFHQHPAWERERIFGGTSTHWGGQSRPEDPIDLTARPNFPGWPITRGELDPFYARASELCNLHGTFPENFTTEYWANVLQADIPKVEGFDVEMYQFIGPSYLNFATRTFRDGDEEKTIGDTDVDIIINASLLQMNHEGGRVSTITVASMNTTDDVKPKPATEFTIKADLFVLACGAVANAQQLLISKAGNENDQVGRYFMCHPLSQGQVITTNNKNYLTESQARLMSGMTPDGNPWTDENGVKLSGRFIPKANTVKDGIGRCWFWYNYGQYYYEMTPNRESRVTLADSVDPVFSKPQVHITWDLLSTDEDTYKQTTGLFTKSVAALGGDVEAADWPSVKKQLVVNGHHIGTTRMSDDPKQGVVDKNLKVHTMHNLYVAGASVFTTAGISNPTFTIITLSIRLADELRGALGKAKTT